MSLRSVGRRRVVGLFAMLLLTAIVPVSLRAQDAPKIDRAALGRRVMTYYTKPEPEKFVELVRLMVEAKVLRTGRPEANVVFLAKVMQANPDKLSEWLDALADLEAADAEILRKAAWASLTDQGKKWLTDHGHAELAKKPGPPLLVGGPMAFEPYHLDQLWEWFFATGEEQPVRRVIGFMNLLPSDPQPGELPKPPANAQDRAAAANFRVGQPAFMSTLSLAIQQDKVFEILKKTEKDPALQPRAKAWLKNAIDIASVERAKRGT